jgi:FMN-dependent NADH-azoreductase
MNNILLIKSSLNGEQSHSNTLSQSLVKQFNTRGNVTIAERDLAKDSVVKSRPTWPRFQTT